MVFWSPIVGPCFPFGCRAATYCSEPAFFLVLIPGEPASQTYALCFQLLGYGPFSKPDRSRMQQGLFDNAISQALKRLMASWMSFPRN